jgi:hypothetical protein
VFIRRVTVHFYWVLPMVALAYNRVLGRLPQEQIRDERMERLRNRKAAVSSQIDERRAAARFEPVADDAASQRDYDDCWPKPPPAARGRVVATGAPIADAADRTRDLHRAAAGGERSKKP